MKRPLPQHQQRELLTIRARELSHQSAAINEQFHANSIRSVVEELIRADQLNPILVLHPRTLAREEGPKIVTIDWLPWSAENQNADRAETTAARVMLWGN
jgi:hypothetical protein